MKICVAQTKPVKGDIAANTRQHTSLIALAASHQAELIVFPELSLTGYEPGLAKALAMNPGDERLTPFQQLAGAHQMIIGIGVPTSTPAGLHITLVLFHPNGKRQTYSKKYLHADELPFFVGGSNKSTNISNTTIELAICYELSVPEHSAHAAAAGGTVYLASVAKSPKGVENAHKTLAEIAARYQMTTLMANSVGPSDDFVGAGSSAVWNRNGQLLSSLDEKSVGILVVDTDTYAVTSALLPG